jgi:hypothetical protein
MMWLVAESYLLLVWVDIVLAIDGLRPFLGRSRESDRRNSSNQAEQIHSLRTAVDLACVLYPKPVLCLQRSVATALLLRLNGIDARLLIGVRMTPFKSHAWVEVDGRPINDKPYMREIYQVLEMR